MNIFMIIALVFGFAMCAFIAAAIVTRTRAVLFGVTAVVMLLGSVGFLMVGKQLYEKSTATWTVDSSIALVSLANASEIKGSSSMFGGSMSEKNVYRFVRETGDGALLYDEIDAAGIRIVQDAKAGQSRIDYETCNYRGGTIWFLDDSSSVLTACGSRTTVHLPEGSVPSEFLIAPKN